MTCIAAVVEKGRVTVGGDSAGVAGLGLVVRADPKVFRVGPFVIGYTSSFRMGQLLMFGFTPPDHDPRMPALEYMVTKFAEAVRTRFKEGGFNRAKDGADEAGQFVVGYRGGAFVVHDDYQVEVPADPFTAVGCGADVALGALHATRGQSPDARVRTALAAAERFSAGVRGPFTVLVTDPPPRPAGRAGKYAANLGG